MSDPIHLTLHKYRGFIQQFRTAMGVGASVRASTDAVDVATVGSVYRYERPSLYLTQGRPVGGGAFQPLDVNYAHMDTNSELSHGTMMNALYAGPGDARARAIIVAITSEAARSQVVYRVIQHLLYSKEKRLKWSALLPLFGVWGHYTVNQTDRSGRRDAYHHKSKPTVFGPLSKPDYYDDPDAIKAMNELNQAGFAID